MANEPTLVCEGLANTPVGQHAVRMGEMVCPRIMSTDVDGFMCKTHLAVRTSGVAA
jgi:hypothetical protein